MAVNELKDAVVDAFVARDDEGLEKALTEFNTEQQRTGRLRVERLEYSPQGFYMQLSGDEKE